MATVAQLNASQSANWYQSNKLFIEANLGSVDSSKINPVATYRIQLSASPSKTFNIQGDKLKYLVIAQQRVQVKYNISSAPITKRSGFSINEKCFVRHGVVSCYSLVNTYLSRVKTVNVGYSYTALVKKYDILHTDVVECQLFDDDGSSLGTYWIAISLLRKTADIAPKDSVSSSTTPAQTAESSRGTTKKGDAYGVCKVGTGIVNATSLNVRSGAGTSYKSIGQLKNKAQVSILECTGEWGKIKFGSGYGWICTKYIKYGAKATSTTTKKTSAKTATVNNVYADPIQHVAYSSTTIPDDNTYISSPEQYTQELDIFDIPENYSRAKMTVFINEDNTWKARSFEFIVGPSNIQLSLSNNVQTIKTGGGNIILRNGAEPTRLQFNGYFLNTGKADERRVFLENYYKKFMLDRVNAFYEYFNDSHAVLEIEGYRYYIVPLSFDLTRASSSLFLFGYTMSCLCTKSEPTNIVSTETGDLSATAKAYIKDTNQEAIPYNLIDGILK